VHECYRRQTTDRQTDGRQHIANVNVSSRSLKRYLKIPDKILSCILKIQDTMFKIVSCTTLDHCTSFKYVLLLWSTDYWTVVRCSVQNCGSRPINRMVILRRVVSQRLKRQGKILIVCEVIVLLIIRLLQRTGSRSDFCPRTLAMNNSWLRFLDKKSLRLPVSHNSLIINKTITSHTTNSQTAGWMVRR